MNNQDFLTYDCKKDKELFNSYVKGLIFSSCYYSFISTHLLC